MSGRAPGEKPHKSRIISFSGAIQPGATKVLRSACCAAVNERVTHLTVLLSSGGGSLDDGFALYGFLRALPLDLTMHNVGMVGSVANAVFLAGKRRLAAPHAIFFYHDLNWTYSTAQTLAQTTMTEHGMLLDSGRARIKALFKLHAQLDHALFESPQFFKEPLIHEPSAAKAAGVIHEIEDAAVPFGGQILNIDWS